MLVCIGLIFVVFKLFLVFIVFWYEWEMWGSWLYLVEVDDYVVIDDCCVVCFIDVFGVFVWCVVWLGGYVVFMNVDELVVVLVKVVRCCRQLVVKVWWS